MHLKDTAKIDENKIQELADEFRDQKLKEYGGFEEYQIKVKRGEIKSDQVFNDVLNLLATKGQKYLLDPYLEANSINPKFKDDVADLLRTSGQVYDKNLPILSSSFYTYVKLTEDQFNSDPECSKKHKEHFSDTMKLLKDNWGY